MHTHKQNQQTTSSNNCKQPQLNPSHGGDPARTEKTMTQRRGQQLQATTNGGGDDPAAPTLTNTRSTQMLSAVLQPPNPSDISAPTPPDGGLPQNPSGGRHQKREKGNGTKRKKKRRKQRKRKREESIGQLNQGRARNGGGAAAPSTLFRIVLHKIKG